jgi:hypothetical protein
VLGIVPLRELLFKYLQSRRKQRQSFGHTNANTSPIIAFFSNSQELKRRQLTHGDRNRAAQLIAAQVPAKSTKPTPILCSDQRKHITRRRLFSHSQLLKRQQLAHGARNRAAQLIVVQVPAKSTKPPLFRPQQRQKHITHRCLCSNSQFLKRRKLAHGARNRAAQLIEVQPPAKATKSPTSPLQTNIAHRRPLIQLTVAEATTAGPRCSESCRSVD